MAVDIHGTVLVKGDLIRVWDRPDAATTPYNNIYRFEGQADTGINAIIIGDWRLNVFGGQGGYIRLYFERSAWELF